MIAFPSRSRTQNRPQVVDRRLRLSANAWGKMMFMLRCGDTVVILLGVTDPNDPMLIVDVVVPMQRSTPSDTQLVSRCSCSERSDHHWILLSRNRSSAKGFDGLAAMVVEHGPADWMTATVVSTDAHVRSRLWVQCGPGAVMPLKPEVDYSAPFGNSMFDVWRDEYLANVKFVDPFSSREVDDAVERWHESQWVAS